MSKAKHLTAIQHHLTALASMDEGPADAGDLVQITSGEWTHNLALVIERRGDTLRTALLEVHRNSVWASNLKLSERAATKIGTIFHAVPVNNEWERFPFEDKYKQQRQDERNAAIESYRRRVGKDPTRSRTASRSKRAG